MYFIKRAYLSFSILFITLNATSALGKTKSIQANLLTGLTRNSNIHEMTNQDLEIFDEYQSQYKSKDATSYDTELTIDKTFLIDNLSINPQIGGYNKQMLDRFFSYYDTRYVTTGLELSYTLNDRYSLALEYHYYIEQWKNSSKNYYTYQNYSSPKISLENNTNLGVVTLKLPFEYHSYKGAYKTFDWSSYIEFSPNLNESPVSVSFSIGGGQIHETVDISETKTKSSMSSALIDLMWEITNNLSISPSVEYSRYKNSNDEYYYNASTHQIDVKYYLNAHPELEMILSISNKDGRYKSGAEIEIDELSFKISYSTK